METYIEQYQAKQGGVTLHTWTEVQGGKKDNFYITGVSGTPVASWFRDGAPHEAPRRYRRLSLYSIAFLCLKRFGGQRVSPAMHAGRKRSTTKPNSVNPRRKPRQAR